MEKLNLSNKCLYCFFLLVESKGNTKGNEIFMNLLNDRWKFHPNQERLNYVYDQKRIVSIYQAHVRNKLCTRDLSKINEANVVRL